MSLFSLKGLNLKMVLLTAKQVAKRLQCTPQQVYILIRDGKLEAVRLSPRMTRIKESEVDKLIGGKPL